MNITYLKTGRIDGPLFMTKQCPWLWEYESILYCNESVWIVPGTVTD